MDKCCWKAVQTEGDLPWISYGLPRGSPYVVTYQIGVTAFSSLPGSLLFCLEKEEHVRAYCCGLSTYTLLYGLATDVVPLPRMSCYTEPSILHAFWRGNRECYRTERTPWGTVGCTSFTPEQAFHLLDTSQGRRLVALQ